MQRKATKDLDSVDRRMLAILVADGRISWNELAEKVGLSNTPVLRRLRSLEADGVIAGYGARLDEAKLGYPASAFVWVTLDSQSGASLAAFETAVADMPEVMTCFMVSGSNDYLLRVIVKDLEAYRTFVSNKLSALPGVARLNSSFALKAVIQRSAPPLS